MSAHPTNVADLAGRAVIDVWSATKPNAAALLGLGRDAAYGAARRGDIPALRLGRRLVVRVPALVALLGEPDAN